MMRIIAFAVLASSALASPALAADLFVPETYLPPMVDQTYDWSGLYLGIHGGYGAARFSGIYDSDEGDADLFASGADLDLQGFLGGVHAGFNVQNGNIVYGLEGDLSFLGWSDIALDGDGTDDDFIEADLDMLATLRGRLGYTIDNLMVFGTAGLSYASGTWALTDDVVDTASMDFDAFGLVVGAGVEAGVTETISVRAEALYHVFDGEFDTSDLIADSDDGDYGALDSLFEVRAGLSFRF